MNGNHQAPWHSTRDIPRNIDKSLDLNEHLIKHPAATFYCRVSGNSMTEIGIFDGDLLIVDRAVKPVHGDVILAALDGELTCKVLDMHQRRLLSSNDDYPPIPIRDGSTFEIEGVVIHSIRYHRVCTG
ncbi:MAG: LexA family protein [Gammaproteobacteria bacterium]